LQQHKLLVKQSELLIFIPKTFLDDVDVKNDWRSDLVQINRGKKHESTVVGVTIYTAIKSLSLSLPFPSLPFPESSICNHKKYINYFELYIKFQKFICLLVLSSCLWGLLEIGLVLVSQDGFVNGEFGMLLQRA